MQYDKENHILISHLPIDDIIMWKNNYNKLVDEIKKYDKNIDDIYISDVQDTYVFYEISTKNIITTPWDVNKIEDSNQYLNEITNVMNISNSYDNGFDKSHLNGLRLYIETLREHLNNTEKNILKYDLSKLKNRLPKTLFRICAENNIDIQSFSIIRCGNGRYSMVERYETNNVLLNHHVEDCVKKYLNGTGCSKSTIRIFLAKHNIKNKYYVASHNKQNYIVESMLYHDNIIPIHCIGNNDDNGIMKSLVKLYVDGVYLLDLIAKKQYSIIREVINGRTFYSVIHNPKSGHINDYFDDMIQKYETDVCQKTVLNNLFEKFNIDKSNYTHKFIRNGKCNIVKLHCEDNLISKNIIRFDNVLSFKKYILNNKSIINEHIFIKYGLEYIIIHNTLDTVHYFGNNYDILFFDEKRDTVKPVNVNVLRNSNLELILKIINK